MFDAYDTDIYVDFTDNDLVITSLDYLTVKVYRLSNSVINKWKEINYTTLYEGTVTDVNIGNNKLLISTVINGDFYLYPYIFTAIDSGISLIPSKVLSESTKIFISRLK